MAARLIETLPTGTDWLYEVKFDGYRGLVLEDGDRIRILKAAKRLNAGQAVLDGEIVALNEKGFPSFNALQHPSHQTQIFFCAFDLLHLDGEDLTARTLEQRRARLSKRVGESGILISDELPGSAAQVIEAIRSLGLEGVIAKRRDSKYEAGKRSGAWVKLKLEQAQEFVIAGFQPDGTRVGALIVGYYEGKQLRFAAETRHDI